MFTVQKMQTFTTMILATLFVTGARAQFVDLSYDKNKNGTNVTTFVLAGEPVKKVSALVVADSTGYGEAFVGTTATFGSLTVRPYVGVEWVDGMGAKPRALVLTSLPLGRFTFNNVNEFGGMTGNFYKTALGYQVSEKWKMSLVHHSAVGVGGRIDITVPEGYTFYLQVLERRATVGVALKF